MSIGETPITVIGNLTADPELRFSDQGVAVVSFTVASTPRFYDRQANEWRDGEALFLRCAAFRQLAENCAESLTRGCRVVVAGRLKQHSFDGRDGLRRTVFEVDVDEIGPSLKWATAKITKADRRRPFDRPAQDPQATGQPNQGFSGPSDGRAGGGFAEAVPAGVSGSQHAGADLWAAPGMSEPPSF